MSETPKLVGETEHVVSPRVWLAAGLPLALLVLASGILFAQVLRLHEAAQRVSRAEQAVAASLDVEARLLAQHGTLLERFVSDAEVNAERSTARETSKALRGLRDLLHGEESQLAQLDSLRAAYQAWTDAATDLSSFDSGAPAFDVAFAKTERLLDRTLEELSQLKREEHRSRELASTELETITRTTIYGALPAMLLMALLLGLNSRRHLLSLAKDFNVAMAGQLEAKRQIEDQSWARELLVRLAATRDDTDVARLGRRLLEELAAAVEARAGTFYLLHDDALTLHADFGMGARAPRVVRTHDGLLGEAITRTEYQIVDDIPEGYLTIQSSLGSSSGMQLALVPCHRAGDVVGIIELAFLTPTNPRKRLLLSWAGETIGAAVSVTSKRARLRTLLEESRRQAEALQSQQEQLRVTNEELSAQTEALKSAHAQLEERKEELEVSNNALLRQRDELGEAQHKLEQRAIELKRANRYKSEFLASMSHELRTPLNSLLILSKTLAENQQGNLTQEQVRFAETIHAGGSDLLALINDVLDLSRIEAGAIELSLTEATLREIVRPVVRITEPIARDRGLKMNVTLHDPDEPLVTDVTRVQQILKNLLSNACKFTSEGSITLSTNKTDSHLSISVKDTGVGIPENQIETIFEAFRQGEGANNRRFSGTGLGLSISKDLAARLGGSIDVETTEGQGSCFTLRLPSSATRAEPLTPGALDQAKNVSRATAPASARAGKPQTLLLVVRNEAHWTDMLGELSRSVDFECLVAHDVDQGLAFARELSPAAVVVDVDLSDQAGHSALERFQEDPSTASLPLHALVGNNATLEATRHALQSVGYLQKPKDLDALRTALSGLLKQPHSPQRVLLVEEQGTNPSTLPQLLAIPGVEFVTVGTVAGALQVLRTGRFSCVVLDLVLPDASGLSLLRELDAGEAYGAPPVIVYTDKLLRPDDEHELRRYSDSIIVKAPRSSERLVDEVKMFLQKVEATLPKSTARPPKHRSKGASFDGKKVLLAEDDVRNVFALSSVLEKHGGLEIIVARNGKEALESLQATPDVDMVLMDLMMPEMDGLEATRRIRAMNGPMARIPIIALTARAMTGDKNACIEAGANDYVTKPIDVEKLVSLMRVWMPR